MSVFNKRRQVLAVALGCMLSAAGLSLAHAAGEAAPVVEAVDGAALKKAIGSHRGKVVVVNLWATWCGPCVAEFPDLAKLQESYRKQGLVLIAASIDEPEDKQEVVDFAKKHKTAFPIYLRKAGSMEKFVAPVDPKWDGAVPTTYIFGRNGKLAGKAMVGQHTYAQLVAAVTPHLK
jgi:thiol-disulfide isomerase/thioredoxin